METQEKSSEITRRRAADLYWPAFLLTGRREISIEVAAEVAVSADSPNPFFADWMRGWQRRLVIARALTAVQDELAESARRTQVAPVKRSEMPRGWSLDAAVTKEDLERALLALDLFPRAVLLVLVFEHMRIPDAATLLDADADLLKKAQAIGLRELTANLAGARASAFSGSLPHGGPIPEMERLGLSVLGCRSTA